MERLASLLVRSRDNVVRSTSLLAAARTLVSQSLCLRRPRVSGGGDGVEPVAPSDHATRGARTTERTRRCKLRVKQAVDGEEMEGGTVYIAQPGMHLLVRAGRLVLTDTKLVHFSRPSIDLLFESVADAYGDRAIGVVLSGSGVDGADGIRDIKAKGGTTLVQDPSSAAHAGMPQAARATRCVDFTLPLEEIGPALASLVAPPAGDET